MSGYSTPIQTNRTHMAEATYRVKANSQAPRNSRLFLEGMRAELGSRFDDVAIVVSELVSNSVRHSRVVSEMVSNSVRHSSDDLTLAVITGEDSLRIEVTDWGPGFSRDAPRGDGMGLNLVEKVASDWGVTLDGICTVWVEISKDL